jgi:hypothetical protein
MLIIEFQNEENIFLISDNMAESFSLKIIKEYIDFSKKEHDNQDFLVRLGYNECLIYSFRLAVKNNLIEFYDIKFLYEGEVISIKKDGKLDHYPSNFSNIGNTLLSKL